MTVNQQWTIARTPPEGWPLDDDFVWTQAPIASPGTNQMLTRTIYLSLDPYQCARRRSATDAVGDVCHGRTVAQVVESNIAAYAPGDYVFNTNGWQTHGLSGEGVSVFTYMFPRKLDPSSAPISTAVGVLGMLGLAAYSGVYVQCQPQPGETVVVSAASGGVGQVAGQIAKIKGCRVVGIAGKPEKCEFVAEVLGFDACVSRLSPTFVDDLRSACPDGADIYFESVGGEVFEAVLPLLNRDSRITLCGMISQIGNTDGEDAYKRWRETGKPTFDKQATQVHGLAVRNFVADYQDRFLAEMADWINDSLVKYKEDLWMGLEAAPNAFRAMLQGGNFGKTLVAVGEDPTLNAVLEARRAGDNVFG